MLEIFTNIKNVKNIRFNLKENEIDTNLIIKKLIATIKRIENENINLKERLTKVEKKLEIKEEEKKKIELSFEVTTLISDNEKKLLDDLILENTEKKFNLLYRLTRDGEGCSTFHTKCDGKGPTIIIIQTTSGYKFGWYTSINWDNTTNNYKKDELAFIFSLNKKKKYKIKVIQMEPILLLVMNVMKKMGLLEDKAIFMQKKWKFFKLNLYKYFFLSNYLILFYINL